MKIIPVTNNRQI